MPTSERDEMPQQPMIEVELFNLWRIDFMGPFPNSNENLYILLDVEYVSRWVETISTTTNDSSFEVLEKEHRDPVQSS